MNTILDQIFENARICETAEDWKSAFDWLAEKTESALYDSLYYESAVRSVLGEEEFDRLVSIAASTYLHQEDEKEEEADEHIPKLIEEMLDYGYQKLEEMVPVDVFGAGKFFEQGWNVYLLMSDNTEILASSRKDLEAHAANGGMFGILAAELEERWNGPRKDPRRE